MLGALIASLLSGEATEALARTRRTLIAYAAAGLLALAGVVFLLGAGYIALSRRVGPLEAALWFAGAAIGFSVIILVTHRILANIRARRIVKRRRNEMTAVASAAAVAAFPAIVAGKRRGLALLLPALAIMGYAVWRQHKPPRRKRTD